MIGPLKPAEITHILKQYQGPMSKSWLSFVSMTLEGGQTDATEKPATDLDASVFLQDWNLDLWEDMAAYVGGFESSGLI